MNTVTPQDINISLDPEAANQLKLMQEHDYTLKDKVFRLKIGGKGCDGFTYDLGWSAPHPDDVVKELAHNVKLHMDPFTAFYCQEGAINYHFDPEGDEGLTFTNHRQEEYHGKFFKDESTVPEFLKNK